MEMARLVLEKSISIRDFELSDLQARNIPCLPRYGDLSYGEAFYFLESTPGIPHGSLSSRKLSKAEPRRSCTLPQVDLPLNIFR
jgi:hypothetical protein